MILKSRLYYALFVVALVMVSLSLIIVCSMFSPGTVTISDGNVPLSALPYDWVDRLENPENYETAQEALAPADDGVPDSDSSAPFDFRDSIPAE